MPQLVLTLVAGVILFLLVGFSRSLWVQYRQRPQLFKVHLLHFVLWASAVGSLSGCFATFRRFSGEQPNAHPVLNVIGGVTYLVILLTSFLILGFFMYREDSRTGKLRRKLPLYERFLAAP